MSKLLFYSAIFYISIFGTSIHSCFIVSGNEFCSDETIKVEYKAVLKELKLEPHKNMEINNFMNKEFVRKQKVLASLRFHLFSDRKEYYFGYQEPMSIDNDDHYGVTGVVSRIMDGEFIYSQFDKGVSYLGGFKVGMKINREIDIEDLSWELTSESKIILGLVCNKAIGSLVNDEGAHSAHYPITAWFAPKLNFRGGPTPFATLPGTILALETQHAIIYAISYKLGSFKMPKYRSYENTMKYPDYLLYMKEWNISNRGRDN